MLSANEIANMKFDRSMGRGYKAEEVDNFLAKVAQEFRSLSEEKEDLEQKLLVLADKLEEYKKDEESMRSALIGAQKLGDSVVRDAKNRAGMIVEDANAKANLIIENAKKAIEREKNGYLRMQREVATFRSKLQLVYKQHLELISSIPVDEAFTVEALSQQHQPSMPEPQEYDMQVKSYDVPEEEELPDIAPDDLLEYSEQADEELPEPGLEQEYEPEPAGGRRESRFGPLKFGKEFDIKRDEKRKK